MSSSTAPGPVTLSMPADASMTRVARLTASSLATMAQMSIDDIDDVKIFVSEVVTTLIEHGRRGPVELRFSLDGDHLTLVGEREADGVDRGHPDLVMTDTVLDAVSDHHEIAVSGGKLAISVSKRAATVSID